MKSVCCNEKTASAVRHRETAVRRRDAKRDLARHGQGTVIDVVCWQGELRQLALLLNCPWQALAALVRRRYEKSGGGFFIPVDANNTAWMRGKLRAQMEAKGRRCDAL
ncbi:MAG: hypothetical protein F9K25_20460 [Candidatus Contendobacter sp.]|nr:MAG: hypothetical protein F9K25_20460 [Candidatus Contendobacter sp.]